ncbi:hypothetical protein BC939DRAFT_21136 [Gamsiella multidivaricata]|uniref:uncharacterized protein n=1 Tax=Gamsiella multidivaricata TaxID=101098 RepID=UPI00221FF567|nr:uncharacterized protein BC939DRAFT_21136 [Gamsiella multidivaricata]KAG0361830.1 hypothetical protein BGZ54_008916 [Gamsiella multidivaricata]KAI7816967.1 hypothetical protein BC939DRAFT_21136 [Gamsiella multidivaricata]
MNAGGAELFKTICADFEDILPNDLHDSFSKILGAQYLHETNHPHHQQQVRGIVWGASLRPIISLHVQITEFILTLTGTPRPIHVHFLYLEASPQTYLSDEALRALGIEDMVVVGEAQERSSTGSMRLPLKVNGYTLLVARSPSDAHFAHLNILGQDFIQLTRAKVFFGGDIPRFEISFA